MKERKYNFVYKITNNLNGDYYYGVHSTDDLDDGYMGSGKRILRSIKKYGVENFTKEYIQFFSCKEDAYSLESKIVTPELINDPHCLNLAIGGYGGYGGSILANLTPEQKIERGKRISKALKGKKTGKPAWNRGISPSEETKKKQSEANKGKHLSEGHRKKIGKSCKGRSAWNKGRHPSKETKKKLSEIHKGEKYINNGFIEKRVKGSEIDIFLNNGWSLGRIKLKKK